MLDNERGSISPKPINEFSCGKEAWEQRGINALIEARAKGIISKDFCAEAVTKIRGIIFYKEPFSKKDNFGIKLTSLVEEEERRDEGFEKQCKEWEGKLSRNALGYRRVLNDNLLKRRIEEGDKQSYEAFLEVLAEFSEKAPYHFVDHFYRNNNKKGLKWLWGLERGDTFEDVCHKSDGCRFGDAGDGKDCIW